jgi:uncharacterized protein (TIGR02996 family)
MSDADALLRAICLEPDEHFRRLIYADLIDGTPRADFIRCQFQKAENPALWAKTHAPDCRLLSITAIDANNAASVEALIEARQTRKHCSPDCPQRLERELLRKNVVEWTGFVDFPTEWSIRTFQSGQLYSQFDVAAIGFWRNVRCWWNRGFIEKVTCSTRTWHHLGHRVVKRHPVNQLCYWNGHSQKNGVYLQEARRLAFGLHIG